MSAPATIFVGYDPDSDLPWRLMVKDSKMSSHPAGPRLFRAHPWPIIEFSHPTQKEADDAAKKLIAYLANLPKAKARKSGAATAF